MNALAPSAVQQQCQENPAAQYIDVRTVAEFAEGRPLLRAVNIPFVFHTPHGGAEVPNGSFVEIIGFLFPTDAHLILGAGADDRAERAADALRAAGFVSVSVMAGGMGAWRAALLPTTRDNRDGVSYVSLLTRFRRKDKAAAGSPAAH